MKTGRLERNRIMKVRLCCLSLVVGISAAGIASAQEREVIGYYPSWKWTSRDNLVTPAKIPYDKLTIINYAFFYPMPDGTITGKDTVGDAMYLRGTPGTRLTDLAREHGVKIMLSLGGWEDSDNFPAVAADPALRAMFVHSCIKAIRAYGFDGIDIDWEYPGFVAHKGTPADRHNYTLLLQTLRDSLTVEGLLKGRNYLLTAALPTSSTTLAMMEIEKVADILDFLNIMTYDFYGPWDPIANHNSPLYPSAAADSSRCVDAACKLFNRTYGIPASKINIGVPFYGQTYTNCTSLNNSHNGADTTHFSRFGAFYYDIVRHIDKCTRYWDERAKVPYLVSKEWKLLISYDDEESVRAKAQYVVDNNLHGLIIWEITGDYMPDGSTPLLNAIHSVFHPSKKTGH
jgi:chitinase